MVKSSKKEEKEGIRGIDLLQLFLDPVDVRRRRTEIRVRKQALYYLEREELDFKDRLEFCERWVIKRLEECKKGLEDEQILRKKNRKEMEKFSEINELEAQEKAALSATAWWLGLAKVGDFEDEIEILERLLEEIEITLGIDEKRINQEAFIGQVMDIIFIPKEKDRQKEVSEEKALRITVRADLIDEFQQDNPNYEKNVFIMMRFANSRELILINNTIRSALRSHGLHGLRADDKTYGDSRLLWENLVTYMNGCRYGIAVLEDFSQDEFNPNVALEYGYMRALGKQVLLLKEKRFRHIRADILGTIWVEFDILNIYETINAAISRWMKDLQ